MLMTVQEKKLTTKGISRQSGNCAKRNKECFVAILFLPAVKGCRGNLIKCFVSLKIDKISNKENRCLKVIKYSYNRVNVKLVYPAGK